MAMRTVTTDVFGPTEEDQKLNRQLAVEKAKATAEADVQAQKAASEGEDYSAPGFKVKPTVAQPRRDVQAFTKAALAGQQLGSPASYGGQQGMGKPEFTQPIPVTRGMTTTYQGPRYGEEFTTPGQAAQAFRREAGEKYVPGAQTGQELGIQTVVDEKGRQRNVGYYTDAILKQRPDLFEYNPQTGEARPKPSIMHLYRGNLRLAENKPDDAVKAFFADLTPHEGKMREKAILDDPQNTKKALANFAKTYNRDVTEAELAYLEQSGQLGRWVTEWLKYNPPQKPLATSVTPVGQTYQRGATPSSAQPGFFQRYPGPEAFTKGILEKYPSPTDLPNPLESITPQAFRRRKEEFQRRLTQKR